MLFDDFFCSDSEAESKAREPPFFEENLSLPLPPAPLPDGFAPESGSYDEDNEELDESEEESSSESSDESSLHESEELELSLLDEHDVLLSDKRSFTSPLLARDALPSFDVVAALPPERCDDEWIAFNADEEAPLFFSSSSSSSSLVSDNLETFTPNLIIELESPPFVRGLLVTDAPNAAAVVARGDTGFGP